MKIIFICGSLENGKDGVGDYTRRLAGQIIRLGHQAYIIGIMDKCINEPKEEIQNDHNTSILTLRLPYSDDLKLNFELVDKWLSDKNPDWLSFQYVPFSYNSKGLNFGLAEHFKQIAKGKKIHIMFHELWVWKRSNNDFKYWLWGKIQERIIALFRKKLAPRVVHTHTKFYKYSLEKLGYSVEILPLFSNITSSVEIEPSSKMVSLKEKLLKNKKIDFVVFGEIHHGSPIDSFSSELAFWSKSNKVSVSIKFVGKNGNEGLSWKNSCINNGIEVKDLGWQSDETVANILSSADIGITSTPFILTEKSGSVAAMQTFGLPVICVARNLIVKNSDKTIASQKGVWKYQTGHFADYINGITESFYPSAVSLQSVAEQFIFDLH